jgi:biopolymer transport protein ExbB
LIDKVVAIFNSGGFMMYPLLISAIIALIIIFERIFALREDKILIPDLLQFIKKMNRKEDLIHAEQLSKSHSGPFGNIMLVGLENRKLSTTEVRQFLEDQGQYEVRYLEKGLNILETIAGIAPLMGLLGTVFGIIKVFNKIEEIGLSDPAAFSGGISEALVTTAVGLVIGIAVLISYNFLTKKAENLVAEIENIATNLIQKIKQLEIDAK